MALFIDWQEWHEGEKVSSAGDDSVFVCIYRNCKCGEIRMVAPHLVARCFNYTGKAKDWLCFLGRTRKHIPLIEVHRPVDICGVTIDRKLFDPKEDKLFYVREKTFRLPPDTFPGGNGIEVFGSINDLFYSPGAVLDRAVGGFN